MDGYIEFLPGIGYSASSIKQHVRYIEVFQSWLIKKSISEEQCNYPELIYFIDDAMIYYVSRTNPKSTLNRMLVAIATYYDHLITGNSDIRNPAKNIRIKNPVHRVAHDLPNKEELDTLYQSIDSNNVRYVKNKVILGFLVIQGLSTGELHRIRLKDLSLRKETLFIIEGSSGCWKKGSAARELDLEALQVIDLKNSLHYLFRNLSELNTRVKNTTQIRQSVITNWLKRYDLRTVQYMAGHRYVSSTEYYKQIDIENLKRKIDEYHPLK